MNGIADHKLKARQAIHDSLAVPAKYEQASTSIADDPLGLRFTVRWHNRLQKIGQLEGGFDAQIIDGIDRLVFNDPQLAALELQLRRGGLVTVAALGNAIFELDSEEPMDGPINRYWMVARVRD
jgi:hypothetical protein